MYSAEEGSNIQRGSSGGSGSRDQGMFRRMGRRLDQPKQDGTVVDEKYCILNALKCFGI
jgi:hypothetical protein